MKRITTLFLLFVVAIAAKAQYITAANAIPTVASTYQLTAASQNQRGAVWATTAVNWGSAWTITAELNFGTINDATPPSTPNGADGIAFVFLRDAPTSGTIGAVGRGIGYSTDPQDAGPYPVSPAMSNSFAFEIDTWYNSAINVGPNDPDINVVGDQDHSSFMYNGNNIHSTVPGNPATAVLMPNVETGLWYPISINWDGANTLTVNFNGQTRVHTGSIASIIGSGATAYWGFTSATGLDVNQHQIRFLDIQQTPTPNPCGGVAVPCGPKKQYVCHKQNGTNGNGTIGVNAHTLCVSDNAVPAHLAHGDCLGECPVVKVAPGSLINTIEEPVTTAGATVYPNPSRGQVQVNIGGQSRVEIQVVNSKGVIVERKVGVSATTSFDLKKYGVGIYLVKVISGNSVQTSKVVVQD